MSETLGQNPEPIAVSPGRAATAGISKSTFKGFMDHSCPANYLWGVSVSVLEAAFQEVKELKGNRGGLSFCLMA